MALLVWQPLLALRLLRLVLRPAPRRVGSLGRRRASGRSSTGWPCCGARVRPDHRRRLSLGVWLFEGASYLVLTQRAATRLPPGATVPAIGLTLVTINLGIMVPSAPGYVGAQEFFGTLALSVFGVDSGTALALIW